MNSSGGTWNHPFFDDGKCALLVTACAIVSEDTKCGVCALQMDMHVMTPSNGFDEGVDAAQWQHWASR